VRAAGQALAHAQRLRSLLTYAVPPIAVQARIELIRAYLARADLAGARTLVREIDELLERRPQLGALVVQARELRALLASHGGSGDTGASTLTAPELRLLPLLATHLTYAEIAAELYVSRNTVKSQTQSVFYKLGAT
jgi:LuxR family maltose regulon positive regulatory protein